MENVKGLLLEIKEDLKGTVSISQKDEVRVMRAMLNDKDYEVGIYTNEGLSGTFSPYNEARDMITNIISDTTKISTAEARQLSEDYEFKKAEAVNMINISKEYINTYLDSGRKLSLGGRETSNVALAKKEVKAGMTSIPNKIGVDDNGKGIYESIPAEIKPHSSIKVYGSCPEWLKK